MRALRFIVEILQGTVCEVLTFLLKTVPRWHRAFREHQESDYALVERLRRRSGD